MAKYRKPASKKVHSSLRATANTWAWIAISLVIIFVAFIRIRLLQMPFERDEGEYAYMGQLMLQGIPPYKLACNMKLPGTCAAYAVFMALFGQTMAGIHLGLLLVNAATIVLVFLLSKRLFNPLAGVVAGATYGILSVSTSCLGLAAHATHFVVFFALGGILLLLKSIESGRRDHLFISGLLFGLSILMKQSGVLFSLFALLYLWQADKTEMRKCLTKMALLLAGIIIPYAILCIFLWRNGVFSKFWFWTYTYARVYSSEEPLSMFWPMLKPAIQHVTGPSSTLWILSGIGLIVLFLDKKARSRAAFILELAICSSIAVSLGCYFRQHYFIQLFPVIALLVGVAVSSSWQLIYASRFRKVLPLIPIVIFVSSFAYTAYGQRNYFFNMSPNEVVEESYGASPFTAALKISEYLKEHTNKNDSIFVAGSEPEIYFFSDRHSATSFIYTYSLTENHKYAYDMQLQMIDEVEKAKPKYIVFVNVITSWMVNEDTEEMMFHWVARLIKDNYIKVGVVDIISLDYTEYVWGADARNYLPTSPSSLSIYRRKE